MNCPICGQEMQVRPTHAFINGSGGAPYEFEVHECYSARQGYKPGEYGRRCEATFYFKPVLSDGEVQQGCPMLVEGLDCRFSAVSTAPVEEDADDSE